MQYTSNAITSYILIIAIYRREFNLKELYVVKIRNTHYALERKLNLMNIWNKKYSNFEAKHIFLLHVVKKMEEVLKWISGFYKLT